LAGNTGAPIFAVPKKAAFSPKKLVFKAINKAVSIVGFLARTLQQLEQEAIGRRSFNLKLEASAAKL
jgi:hypothetical protein